MSENFSAEERAAMKETARERRSQSRKGVTPEDLASEVLAKIAEMPEPDRTMAARLHELVLEAAPALAPKTWYGMPAYYLNGKNICFFQNPAKFKVRYFTLGFSDSAQLDEGQIWPTSFAITELTKAVERQVTALVKQAVA